MQCWKQQRVRGVDRKGGHEDEEENASNIWKYLWSLLWIDPVILDLIRSLKYLFIHFNIPVSNL